MQCFTTMKPPTTSGAAHRIAEAVRTQLGTDAVILITPGTPTCAVVIARAPDTPISTADGADCESADGLQNGEKLAYSVAEAARALGLSHSLIYDQLRTG